MERVFVVFGKLFDTIFIDSGSTSLFTFVVRFFTNSVTSPYLLWGVIFLIIGFSVGVLKRIIHS